MLTPNLGAEGSCSVRSGQAKKPDVDPRAVAALRSFLTMAEPAPNSTFKFENKVYKQADLLKIIEEEDAGECGAGRSGDSRSQGGGSAAGQGGGVAAGGAGAAAGEGVARGRKSRHCVHRLLACMMRDDHRNDFICSGEKANRAQLDAGEVGASAGAWLRLHATFTDKDMKVG